MSCYNVAPLKYNTKTAQTTSAPAFKGSQISFGAGINTTNIRTSLATKEEKEKYNTVAHLLK